ncbi:hypothetical protein Y5A_024415 [Burkholderia glumae AU6208]|nr:hypothetical protein Y5A_024415 [Burkholderia glumae AU6208]
MRCVDQRPPRVRIERLLAPESIAIVIVLSQRGETVDQARLLRGVRVEQLEAQQVRLDHVFGRRQDIGDQIVAQLDLLIQGAVDAQLFQH